MVGKQLARSRCALAIVAASSWMRKHDLSHGHPLWRTKERVSLCRRVVSYVAIKSALASLVVLLFLTLLGEEDLHEREVFRPFDVPLSVGIILKPTTSLLLGAVQDSR